MKYKVLKFKIKWIFALLICVLFMFCLVAFSNEVINGVKMGLDVCCSVLIPSLFPFTIGALFLFESGVFKFVGRYINYFTIKVFNLTGEQFSVYLASMISGYPVGSRLVNKLYLSNGVSKFQANRMLGFCINAGPAFIIVGVGEGILMSKNIGYLLLVSHIGASLIVSFVTGLFSRNKTEIKIENTSQTNSSISDALVVATSGGCNAMLSICSWVVLFSSIISVIKSLPIANYFKLYLCSFLEVTLGIREMSFSVAMVSFLLGFSCFSVVCQSISGCENIKPNFIYILITRIFNGIISFIITKLLFKCNSDISVQVVSFGQSVNGTNLQNSLPASIALVFLSIVFFAFVSENRFKKREKL